MASVINPVVRGWLRYYGRFNVGQLLRFFARLELRLAHWARRKYKHLRRSWRRALELIRRIRIARPTLFVHWQALYTGSKA